jgi:nicotinamide phosphoribosyltransferase
MLVVYNTNPEFPWLPGYIESWLLSVIWHQSTVATKSLAMKTVIKDAYAKTGEPFLGSPVVDFGVRGSAGGPMGGLHASAAALGGFAYLMVSDLSDNVPALHFAQAWGFRGPLKDQPLPPSILATEHSVMTSFEHSFGHHEQAAFDHLLATAPDKPISIVMDAYDLFRAINTLGIHFRDLFGTRFWPAQRPRPSSSAQTLEIRTASLPRSSRCWPATLAPRRRTRATPCAQPARTRDPGRRHFGRQAGKHLRRRHWRHVRARQSHLWFGGGLLQSATCDTLKFAYKASAGVIYDKSVQIMSKDPI